MSGDSVVLAAVGDTIIGFDPPERAFQNVMSALRDSDLRFAQVETIFSQGGTFQDHAQGFNLRLHPKQAGVYKTVPFDVVSLAGNHAGDWGPDGLQDTVDTFRKLGIAPIGAGRLAEARKPAIVEKKGIRVAFLAYCSVLLPQSWATEERAGANPMRAKTYYETVEYQPGAPPKIVTIPDKRDLEQMQEDVQKAKQETDFVVVSHHWGVHFITKPLTDYQPVVGRAAIDAGAGLVLGHHPHLIQGIERYKGAVIFYGLGNFVIHQRTAYHKARTLPVGEHTLSDYYERDVAPGIKFAHNHHWPPSLLVYATIDRKGLSQVTVTPTLLDAENAPIMLEPGSEKFEEIRTYTLWASDGIDGGITELPVENGRMVVYRR